MISLLSFSTFISPPKNWLMGIFRGYFDDSGHKDDHNVLSCSLGGYLGTCEDWKIFERTWEEVLHSNGIPFLHMKDFAPCNWPYEKYQNDKAGRANLLESLIMVIKKSNLIGFVSSVYIEDLIKVNNDLKREDQIDAYVLNLYTCMRLISNNWPNTAMDIKLDRTNGVSHKIPKAIEYAENDKNYHDHEYLSISPLPKGCGYIDMPPIQAADLIAYEVAKENKTVKELINNIYVRRHFTMNGIRYALRRQSFEKLLQQTPVKYFRWDVTSLRLLKYGGYLNINHNNEISIELDDEKSFKFFLRDFFNDFI